jgi:hypothetical protein
MSVSSQGYAMFVVTEAEAAAIRAAFDRGGELLAAVESRRLFPSVTDNAQARVRADHCRLEATTSEAPAGQPFTPAGGLIGLPPQRTALPAPAQLDGPLGLLPRSNAAIPGLSRLQCFLGVRPSIWTIGIHLPICIY